MILGVRCGARSQAARLVGDEITINIELELVEVPETETVAAASA